MSRRISGFGRPCADEEPSEILVGGIERDAGASVEAGEPDTEQSQSAGASVEAGAPDVEQTQSMTSSVSLS
jgi:hypothetical protein